MTTKDYYNHLQPCDRGLSSIIKNREALRVSDILEWGHVTSLHPDLVSNVFHIKLVSFKNIEI